MIIIISVIAVLILGILIVRKDDLNTWGIGCMVIGGLGVVMVAIMLPLSYFDMKSQINKYYITKHDIQQSRNDNLSEVERAALTTKIIELNRGLADAKYWNGTIFDIFIPDEVMDLEYLK